MELFPGKGQCRLLRNFRSSVRRVIFPRYDLSLLLVGNRYGFIDSTGKTVIEPKYDLTFHSSEGLAAVMVGGKWGYIDTTGKMVIQPMPLQRAEDFHNGLAFVSTKDGKYGYIDRSGKYVWTPTLLYRN